MRTFARRYFGGPCDFRDCIILGFHAFFTYYIKIFNEFNDSFLGNNHDFYQISDVIYYCTIRYCYCCRIFNNAILNHAPSCCACPTACIRILHQGHVACITTVNLTGTVWTPHTLRFLNTGDLPYSLEPAGKIH